MDILTSPTCLFYHLVCRGDGWGAEALQLQGNCLQKWMLELQVMGSMEKQAWSHLQLASMNIMYWVLSISLDHVCKHRGAHNLSPVL